MDNAVIQPSSQRQQAGLPASTAQRRGLSLVESTLAIAIVSTLLTASLGLLGSASMARLVHSERGRCAALARELLTEIVQYPYQDTDDATRTFGREQGESGGSRIDFDDVDDYDGWSESPPEEKDGTVRTILAGWRREVAITTLTIANSSGLVNFPLMELRRIVVTVTDPDGKAISLVSLRSNVGAPDKPPPVTTTYLTWMGMNLQIGPEARSSLTTGINLDNQVIISQGP